MERTCGNCKYFKVFREKDYMLRFYCDASIVSKLCAHPNSYCYCGCFEARKSLWQRIKDWFDTTFTE